jgi:hypothetical protein
MDAVRAGVLNIPEHVDAFRPFHTKQCGACRCIPVLQFFDLVPLEPETAATALTGMCFNTRNLQDFQFVVTRRTVHRTIILYE